MGTIENPPESTGEFYEDGYYGGNAEGHGYADYHMTAEHTQLWVRLMVEAIRSSGRILDIGCADGYMLSRLPKGYELFGIEANVSATEQAKAKGITVLSNDIAALSDSAERFDVISSIATFEHVLDFRQAFDLSLRSLKPDGVLIFDVPLMSESEDNRDWLNASYEHISYPTVSGMQRLFSELPAYCRGFESKIRGFSSTYIGLASPDEEAFNHADQLFEAMTAPTLSGLTPAQRCLNLSYHVVHGFDPNYERIAALPEMAKSMDINDLMPHLCRLWLSDSLLAERSAFAEQQAKNWRAAYDQLLRDTTAPAQTK